MWFNDEALLVWLFSPCTSGGGGGCGGAGAALCASSSRQFHYGCTHEMKTSDTATVFRRFAQIHNGAGKVLRQPQGRIERFHVRFHVQLLVHFGRGGIQKVQLRDALHILLCSAAIAQLFSRLDPQLQRFAFGLVRDILRMLDRGRGKSVEIAESPFSPHIVLGRVEQQAGPAVKLLFAVASGHPVMKATRR
uniref:Putative secreted protein n=1 Tax=Anopheles marajoara TaxID=58244 RepID=A0A2M4C5U1_9DIPT